MTTPKKSNVTPGRVLLVGAGPGDPELLTLKAARLLEQAEVVVHDRLVGEGVLALINPEAQRIEVGKKAGGPSWKQAEINDLLCRAALEGRTVLRLKAGDPGIFGRADEEIAALLEAGLDYEIVPGITSAASAAASAGVSLTRRGRNKSIALLTAHDAKGFAELDWPALAAPGAAAAIYMGVTAARFLQGRLLLHGASRDMPVTVVENASRADEVIATGTLDFLPELIREEGIAGPAIIFLGLRARNARVLAPELLEELRQVREAAL